jgi:hypothetical protein
MKAEFPTISVTISNMLIFLHCTDSQITANQLGINVFTCNANINASLRDLS